MYKHFLGLPCDINFQKEKQIVYSKKRTRKNNEKKIHRGQIGIKSRKIKYKNSYTPYNSKLRINS